MLFADALAGAVDSGGTFAGVSGFKASSSERRFESEGSVVCDWLLEEVVDAVFAGAEAGEGALSAAAAAFPFGTDVVEGVPDCCCKTSSKVEGVSPSDEAFAGLLLFAGTAGEGAKLFNKVL
jgi:hypothetical protein